jgi:hypothetical protein
VTREHLVRALWTLYEPIHAVTYFSTQAREGFAAVGLTRYWDGYFAGRSAPLGRVTAAPVTAIFAGFSPFLVERALPNAWSTASPEQVMDARSAGAAATIRSVFEDEGRVGAATTALTEIALRADVIGRPLAAANQAIPEYEDPYRRLWQAAATLREHRGDGHVTAQVTERIAGLTAIVLRSGADIDAATMKRARGWTDEQWEHAADALVVRGLLGTDGIATPDGLAALRRTENLTNRLALQPWESEDDQGIRRIAELLHPISSACATIFPYPNPIGIPQPWDAATDPDAVTVPEGPSARV